MMTWVYTIGSVIIISLISLVGVFSLAFKKDTIKKILLYLVAFSAGALIGDSFLHLLPEAFESGLDSMPLAIAIFSGILVFFLLEKVLRWRHCHNISCSEHPRHLGTMNLVGDAMHNLIDGFLIGVSFLVSVPLGIATTIAVLLHEIPQEMGDFGVLLHSGFSIKKAIFFNLLSSFTAIIAAVIALVVGNRIESFAQVMIPFTVGSFIYIALSDLIPELHKESGWGKTIGQLAALIGGISVMALLLLLE